MTTLLVSQSNFDQHQTPVGHPERADRIAAVEAGLAGPRFAALERRIAPEGDLSLARLVHDDGYIEALARLRPAEGIVRIDEDTFISAGSLDAVATALGAGLTALEAVALGEATNAFCAVRPPGHHAERGRPMGFCLINTIAVVAREAQRKFGAERVAIIDFDVHHGNGTEDIFKDDPSVLYASSHQWPLYPGTGDPRFTGANNTIVNVGLEAGSGTRAMRAAYEDRIFPAIDAFRPDFVLISAGFDADARDPLAGLDWGPADFSWVTDGLCRLAARHCDGRVVSMLEGGYDLTALADDAAAHVEMLLARG
jgi:acetoin utilization deacetylase AcuC-like enzyme